MVVEPWAGEPLGKSEKVETRREGAAYYKHTTTPEHNMTRNDLLAAPLADLTDAQVNLAQQCKRMGAQKPSAPEQRVLDLMATRDRVDLYHLNCGAGWSAQVRLLADHDVDTRTTDAVIDRLAMRGLLAGTVVQHRDGTEHVHADCTEHGGGTLKAPAVSVEQALVNRWLA